MTKHTDTPTRVELRMLTGLLALVKIFPRGVMAWLLVGYSALGAAACAATFVAGSIGPVPLVLWILTGGVMTVLAHHHGREDKDREISAKVRASLYSLAARWRSEHGDTSFADEVERVAEGRCR